MELCTPQSSPSQLSALIAESTSISRFDNTAFEGYTFDFANRGLSGTIPDNFFVGLARAKNFSVFDLSGNSLSGTLPRSLASVSGGVRLFENRLTGTLPSVLGSIALPDSPAYYYIGPDWLWTRIDSNNLTGTIPSSIGSALMYGFNWSHNAFSGTIPDSFCSLLDSLKVDSCTGAGTVQALHHCDGSATNVSCPLPSACASILADDSMCSAQVGCAVECTQVAPLPRSTTARSLSRTSADPAQSGASLEDYIIATVVTFGLLCAIGIVVALMLIRRQRRLRRKPVLTRGLLPRIEVSMQHLVTRDIASLILTAESVDLPGEMVCIGAGASGRVYKASVRSSVTAPNGSVMKPGTELVRDDCNASLCQDVAFTRILCAQALKEMYSLAMEQDVSTMAKELGFVAKLHHPNIVQFVGLFRDETVNPPRYFLTTEMAVRALHARHVLGPNCARTHCMMYVN